MNLFVSHYFKEIEKENRLGSVWLKNQTEIYLKYIFSSALPTERDALPGCLLWH